MGLYPVNIFYFKLRNIYVTVDLIFQSWGG